MAEPEVGAQDFEPERAEIIELYKLAIDEYHFQVTLNWSRSQYYLALNVAIISVGAGLIQLKAAGRVLVACLFIVGLAATILSMFATFTQQNYYRAARDGKRRLEQRLKLGEFSIRTTPGMGSVYRRLGTINTFNYALLLVLAGVDVVGLAYILLHR